MVKVSNNGRIEDVYQKFDFFVGQTSKGTNEYLAAASLLNDYRVEISGMVDYEAAGNKKRIDDINKSIDQIFANLHICYPGKSSS